MTSTPENVNLTFEYVEVSPALAQSWLNANVDHNRKVSKSKVDEYAEIYLTGHWFPHTGETIKFAVTGELIDGQHRLLAVVRAGTSVGFWVCRGIPRAAFHVLDQGWSRSKLWWEDKEARATVSGILRFKNGREASQSRQWDMENCLRDHQAPIMFALHAFSSKTKGIATAMNRAIVARATYHTSAGLLTEFVDCLFERRTASTENRQLVITKLLTYWASGHNLQDQRSTRYRKTERALQAFIKDEPLSKLYEASGELFPLPEEAE